jgi:RNA polymerase sigma factor (sigma-70 family)
MAFFKIGKLGKTNTDTLSDEAVVERILAGEQQLQEVLYDRYSAKIYHKCLSLLKDKEAAKDCTHDIIVKIFMNLANFKGKSAFSLWVHSISYNYCIDYLTKQKRTGFSEFGNNDYENLADDEDSLQNKLLQDLKLTQLEAVFELLGADEKLILMMRYQDGMSVRDISETLDIGESAVKMRLKRGRDHLAELIGELQKKQT